MNFHFNMAGMGAVSPAGSGVACLRYGRPPALELRAGLDPSQKKINAAVVPTELALWKKWPSHPRLRRAGPLTYFLAEAVEQALTGTNVADGATVGLSVAFSNGVLSHTRRFYEELKKTGANPGWFPETVFNAPLSHVLAALGREGTTRAWVGDASALAQAWLTAGLWIETGAVDVAVVAASEELDPAVIEVAQRMGWARGSQPVLPAEGAVAFALRAADQNGGNGTMHLHTGRPWGRGKEAPEALAHVLEEFSSDWSVWDGFRPPPGPARRAWLAKPPHRRYLSDDLPYLGEAHATSAGWALARMLTGADIKEGRTVILPLLGASHQVGALAWAPDGK
jgi:hypothetical protein